MKHNMPKTPFSTRLSGSAKETELRLRSIFRWKKKRPPIVAFVLVAALILSCCGLVSCQMEANEQGDDSTMTGASSGESLESNATAPWTGQPFSSETFFASYVTDFPEYSFNGAHSATVLDCTIELEDTPENVAEEMVWNNEWYPFVGNYESYIALMGSEHMRISAENEVEGYSESRFFSTVNVHALSVLTEQDYQPTSFYFSDETTANRFLNELWNDVHEYGLTEYTVAYIDLSWEWTPEQLALGPQLGSGRYERLYLLGKTETDPEWKMYNIYWGEYDLNRIVGESQNDILPWKGEPITFPDGNLSIVPPESWLGKVAYQISEDEVYFYLVSTAVETGAAGAGHLCTVKYIHGDFYPLNYSFPWPGKTIAMTSEGSYVYWTPSDVQFTPKTEEEYTALYSQVHEIQFELSDWLRFNSVNEQNPDVPELITTTRSGKTMVVTENTVMTNCYSYTYSDPADVATYGWFRTGDDRELIVGDVVLVLEEVDGMSRVMLPYGDIPRLYGFVDSDLLSDDKARIPLFKQAIIPYEIPGYAAPGGGTPVTTLMPCTVAWFERQDGWARVQPLGTGEDQCWVDSSHLYFGFDDENVVDAPTGINFGP